MTHPALYRRILRRETHSPRATIAIIVAAMLVVVFAWIGTESVLALLGRPALLVAPADALTSTLAIPTALLPSAIIGGGALVAVLGLLLLLVAVLPGRRARHTGPVGRTAVVVDNAVIASALARTASTTANIDPDQVVVTVGRRTADVRVQRSSGFSVNEARITAAVEQHLQKLELAPALSSTVTLEKQGVVGA